MGIKKVFFSVIMATIAKRKNALSKASMRENVVGEKKWPNFKIAHFAKKPQKLKSITISHFTTIFDNFALEIETG